MAKAMKFTHVLALLAVVVVAMLFISGSQQAAPAGMGDGGVGYATTIKFDVLNKYMGHLPTTLYYRIYDNANKPIAAETAISGSPTSVSTMPNSLSGYILIGNDNGLGTDDGADLYYEKHSFSYVNDAAPHLGTYLLSNESTVTWYGYDAGTLETTTNFTIGAGETYTRGELEIAAGADACIGNPQFKKVGVAFNCTDTATAQKFDEIRPKTGWYTGTDDIPEFLAGEAFIGSVYILSSDAYVCDYGTYRFPIVVDAEASSNPASGESCYAHLLDWTYYIDDNNILQSGWEDRSTLATDVDIGIDTHAGTGAKQIAFG